MNFKKIRSDFPIFGKKGAPKELIYLDSAATSQKPISVIDAITDFYKNSNSNVHRGIYDLSEQNTAKFEATREKVAKFINADSKEIIFTYGATDSINFVAQTWARQNLSKGDEILLSPTEHVSNFLPWQVISKDLGVSIKYFPFDSNNFVVGFEQKEEELNLDNIGVYGELDEQKIVVPKLDYDFWKKVISNKTKLIAFAPYSNVIGPIFDFENFVFEDFIKRVREVGAKILIDASQMIAHCKVDVQKWGADFLAFSSHKLLGPTGVGILYIKKDLHDSIEPFRFGGSMVYSADVKKSIWKEAPHKFEAGTPPIAGVIGLGAALDYINSNIDFNALKEHEAKLCSKLLDGLESIKDIEILGNKNLIRKDGHLVSFNIKGIHPHDIAAYLDMRGIMVRAGNHCAQPFMNMLGKDSSLRVSFYLYNNLEEVDLLLLTLNEAINSLKKD
ncbi:TPA: cysteine desulfurase [Candidatus Dependentiae bacterium]|nr:MAG: Cysteine desulfurase [candidate division TM6 bacterium GW2011_GWE2_31_21]KKP53087.1 MAG: Cysteine desulfurase [candidate division TM6 bacterium GW2011_GWF2_33_332]HBS47905.1 cysteine desulfurase [Candidatus Dependentiae bacterium]HBZ73491.1 cysteine desulfurase [Candidatus Dependentiae bacterium]